MNDSDGMKPLTSAELADLMDATDDHEYIPVKRKERAYIHFRYHRMNRLIGFTVSVFIVSLINPLYWTFTIQVLIWTLSMMVHVPGRKRRREKTCAIL